MKHLESDISKAYAQLVEEHKKESFWKAGVSFVRMLIKLNAF